MPKTDYDTAVAALKTFADRAPKSADWERYREEANAEKADRGAVILHAANVENALEMAVVRHLRLKGALRHEMFRMDGALGSFANKITMADALGMIGPMSRKNLDIIRIIRNCFAHAKAPLNFDDEQVKSLCGHLMIPEAVKWGSKVLVAPPISEKLPVYRSMFQQTCVGMELNLVTRDFTGRLAISVDGLLPAVRESLGPATEIWAQSPPLP